MAFEFNLFGKQLIRLGKPEQPRPVVLTRGFRDAESSRLTADFKLDYGYTALETMAQLPIMRGRSRALCKDNPYAKKWLWLLVTNIIGADGITLDVQARSPNGKLDTGANQELEYHFKRWGDDPEWCDMSGRKNWSQTQQLALRTIAKDGEHIIQMVDGADNPYSFALKSHRVDALDVRYNEKQTRRGTYIHNGVEYDQWGKPLYYWMRKSSDIKYHAGGQYSADREPIPARDIIHPFIEEQEGQSRGWPWLYSAIRKLHMLDGYENSELAAARDCANSLGVYYREKGEDMADTDPDFDAERNELEQSVRPSEPGAREVLPVGWRYAQNKSERPNQAFADFNKAMLRAVAAGGLVHYNTLANDLEGVSYSSLRDGKLSERDMYKVMQAIFAAQVCRRVYLRWLGNYLSFFDTGLPFSKLWKFSEHRWHGRRWPWVDPNSEAKMYKMARDHGWKTDKGIAQEMGEDLETNIDQIKETDEMATGTYLENNYDNEKDKSTAGQ